MFKQVFKTTRDDVQVKTKGRLQIVRVSITKTKTLTMFYVRSGAIYSIYKNGRRIKDGRA